MGAGGLRSVVGNVNGFLRAVTIMDAEQFDDTTMKLLAELFD